MPVAFTLIIAAALGVACGGSSPKEAGDALGDAPADTGDGGDGGLAAVACPWDPAPRELVLPNAEVSGVLSGASRNASTTCTRQRGAGGPDAIYLVRLTERAVLELEVVSELDTVLAIRTACSDPLTELACNDTPATIGVDAGPPTPFDPDGGVTEGRDARLRVSLAPGAYYVIVDEAEPFGVGGSFTLKARATPPPAQATCFGAPLLSDGASLLAEQLDQGEVVGRPCGASPGLKSGERALFYAVRIPPGERLTVRARALGGDRTWRPVLTLLTGCAGAGEGCLSAGTTAADGDQVMRYVNNDAVELSAVIAVSAGNGVTGAIFRLDVNIGPPALNFACTTATPLVDGQTLRGQDLAEGQPSQQACGGDPAASLFYRVRLLPFQSMRVRGEVRNPFVSGPLMLTVQEACEAAARCEALFPDVPYVNGSTARTIVVRANTFPGFPPPLFDLTLALPLPPGGIDVAPRAGLLTSEAGGEATFDVALTSPPLEPVTIGVTSSDPGEATARPSSLRFDPATWDRPQRVTVTGVDDPAADGVKGVTISLAPAESADPRYQGLDAPDVDVTNLDDEPGFRITGLPVGTSERGTRAPVAVFLNRAPAATVRLPVRSSNEGEGKVSVAELVFEPASWREPRRFEVIGQDDLAQDGVQRYQVILGPATSSDAAYAGLDPADLDATNADDDFVSTPAVQLPPPPGCFRVLFGGANQLAVDTGGSTYALLMCDPGSPGPSFDGGAPDVSRDAGADASADAFGDGGSPLRIEAYVVAIGDGGRAIGPSRPLGEAAWARVVAGAAGHVAVLLNGPLGLSLAHSEDGGQSWRHEALTRNVGDAEVAAAGTRIAVAARSPAGAMVFNSENFGRSFTTTSVTSLLPIGSDLLALSVQPDDSLWVATYDGSLRLIRSRDGARTFDDSLPPVGVNLVSGIVAFGRTDLFGVGVTDLVVAPLERPDAFEQVSGLSGAFVAQAMAVHPDGGLTMVDRDAESSGAVLRRLPAGARMFSASRNLPAMNGVALSLPASVVPLSNQAVGLLLHRNGEAWFSVEAFP
jgi:hypothetical protein